MNVFLIWINLKNPSNYTKMQEKWEDVKKKELHEGKKISNT